MIGRCTPHIARRQPARRMATPTSSRRRCLSADLTLRHRPVVPGQHLVVPRQGYTLEPFSVAHRHEAVVSFGPILEPRLGVRHQPAVVGHLRFELAEPLEDSGHGCYFRLVFVAARDRSTAARRVSISRSNPSRAMPKTPNAARMRLECGLPLWSLATSETLGPAAYMVVSRARWRRLRGASSRALTSSRLIMIGSFRSLLGNGIRSMLTCRLSVCV